MKTNNSQVDEENAEFGEVSSGGISEGIALLLEVMVLILLCTSHLMPWIFDRNDRNFYKCYYGECSREEKREHYQEGGRRRPKCDYRKERHEFLPRSWFATNEVFCFQFQTNEILCYQNIKIVVQGVGLLAIYLWLAIVPSRESFFALEFVDCSIRKVISFNMQRFQSS